MNPEISSTKNIKPSYMLGRSSSICITRTLPHPNKYTLALEGEFSHCAFSEERAPKNRGQWRQQVFTEQFEKVGDRLPLDLEIGTGNGFHFSYRSAKSPERCILGIEIKYKPLIQAIRRARSGGLSNAAMIRYHAFDIEDLFLENEINDIYIHFPDPWVAPRKPKNRVVNREVLSKLFRLQRAESTLEFKTDSREYFLWALEEIKETPYKILVQDLNLHQSMVAADNFITSFEKIFIKKGIEINYIKLLKP